ncbi:MULTISPECIES: NAD(P)H-binding protein [unclassified Microbacterium]|uniref:NAD(P)H-binding protein n=1 Tax=unclassified Microbacterium TaxID=2609290 RepID=UPI0025F650A8|nr:MULTISPECIES: NAD(P)H-binding protein [unclassified Microbacterium]
MKVAITGGSGFVGRALADRLEEPVAISRRSGTDITDVDALTAAFAGCDAVAHCAGINREIGDQTFRRVHVEGTAAVVEAARRAGVRRLVMVSFLRARPDCGSAYHESKWEAEEIIRGSGLPHTILKSGMIYGPGDHMVDHVTRAVRTLPFFWTVGYRERTARPVPVEDAADVLVAALEGRIPEPTVAVMGADEVTLGEAIRRIARVAGRRPAFLPVPAWVVRVLAQLTEWTMVVPLVAKAQARMLAEGVSEPAPWAPEPPEGIRPSRPFDDDRIRAALPTGRFGLSDLRLVRALRIA